MNDDETTLQRHPSQPLPGFDRGFSDQTCINEHGETVPEDAVWEYHEPWSWTSICSATGSKWVWDTTGDRDFASAAKRFTRDLVQNSSCDNYLSAVSVIEEVDESIAFNYVDGKLIPLLSSLLTVISHSSLKHSSIIVGRRRLELLIVPPSNLVCEATIVLKHRETMPHFTRFGMSFTLLVFKVYYQKNLSCLLQQPKQMQDAILRCHYQCSPNFSSHPPT